MAARGEVVLAFAGADGEFLFAAVEGDVAPARYGEDVREADAVGVVGFFGNRQGLAAFAFGEFGDFFGGDEGDSAFVADGEDVRFAVRQGLQGDGAACATGGDEGFAAFGFAGEFGARDEEAVAVVGGDEVAAFGFDDGGGDDVRTGVDAHAAAKRFAVAARGWQAVQGEGVAAAVVGEQAGLLVAAAADLGEVGVAVFVGERRAVDGVSFATADPAHFGEDEGDGFARRQFGLVKGDGRFALDDDGAARVAVGFGVGGEFVGDEGQQAFAALQQFVQMLLFGGERFLFGADLDFFKAGEVAQAGVQDGFGLCLAEGEGRHEDGARFVFCADDADDFVEVEVGDEQALQDVQALIDRVQAVVQAAAHGFFAVHQPFAQDLSEVFHLRTAVKADHVHLRAVAFFEVGGGEEVLHQPFVIDAVGARHEDKADGVFVVGFVAQVFEPGEFFRLHLFGDLFLYFAAGDLVGQLVDDDVAVFQVPGGAQPHRAASRAVERGDFFARGDEFAAGGEVGRGDVLHQRVVGQKRIGDERAAGGNDFAEVVRQEVGRHADGNAAAAVQEDIRQAGGQARRFLQGAVKV